MSRRSGRDRARRAGKITVHRLDPAIHVGRRGCINLDSYCPDGRSHLDHTTDTVLALLRATSPAGPR
ncbi:hypothetical protein ACFZAG_27915 [Streptomyces sp. NPDC012403]|uniref:hypothetical protein n=1 Tax=Streptomyces sp. NPDC012403 TaxID=3364831 RepID=UPI0036E366C5